MKTLVATIALALFGFLWSGAANSQPIQANDSLYLQGLITESLGKTMAPGTEDLPRRRGVWPPVCGINAKCAAPEAWQPGDELIKPQGQAGLPLGPVATPKVPGIKQPIKKPPGKAGGTGDCGIAALCEQGDKEIAAMSKGKDPKTEPKPKQETDRQCRERCNKTHSGNCKPGREVGCMVAELSCISTC